MRFNQRWLVSLLGGLLGISLIINYTQWQHARDQQIVAQTARHRAADIITSAWMDITLNLKVADEYIAEARWDDSLALMEAAADRLIELDRHADLYDELRQDPLYSFGLDDALFSYGIALSNLSSALSQQSAMTPDQQRQFAALRHDTTLMSDLFPNNLLADGTPDQLAAALTQFCQQMQLVEMRDRITGMDDASTAACR